MEWNLLASCKIVPLEFRQREGNFRNLRKMRWKFKYYGEKVKQLWEHLSRRKKLCGGTMFETYFEGNSCEEKLNSSKLSALRRIEWFPLEFSFSFFFSPLFFFWYWKLIDVEELSREKSTRESQLFLNNFRINIPKILKNWRKESSRSESETLFD